MSTNKALSRVVFWFDISLIFTVSIFLFLGRQKALEFLSGYIIEQSLSIDNLFLFILVFTSFGIKLEDQRRVLNYGIIGAFVLRLIFIVLGVMIVNIFRWVLYLFGFVLLFSGCRMFQKKEDGTSITDSKILKQIGKIVPVTDTLEGDRFFVKKNNVTYITPLFAILILIEISDIIFAIDSIPAIFSVTTDPYIIYLSNICAILGLRNMYFLLGKIHERFKYFKFGVAAILTFTGIKLSILMFNIHIPTEWSLVIILLIALGSIAASLASKPYKIKNK